MTASAPMLLGENMFMLLSWLESSLTGVDFVLGMGVIF